MAIAGVRGWADLPDSLLHSVIALLGMGSFRELGALAATCRSWRTAFSAFSALMPPLLLEPDVPPRRAIRPHPFRSNLVPNCTCHLTDIANQDASLCCEISLQPDVSAPPPRPPPESFCFRGASFGSLFLSSRKTCVVIDVFTGVTISPPQLPIFGDTELCYGALTAPLASPNSHLIVDTGSHNLFWRVGGHSWVRRSPDSGTINRIVVFKGQVFGMDSDRRLFKVQLTSKICIREMRVQAPSLVSRHQFSNAWLVACDDMILMIVCRGTIVVKGETFRAFRLDTSAKPVAWVEVERLENRAIFISTDKRSQPLSCANPELWGGRSNCVYFHNHEAKCWVAFELGLPLQGDVFVFTCCDSGLVQPIWVVPSMLYPRP